MPKRLTLEYVEQCFEEGGCELLEKEYINCGTKMKYRCSCGDINKISFSKFRQGHRCAKCGGTEKYTLKYVKQYFEDHGCELLETEYINAHIKMIYKCSCGNISKISFSNFNRGKRCRKCSGYEKLTLEYVEQYFLDNNCKLLEKIYKNSSTPMRYRCVCGNISKICFSSFQQGCRCIKCGGTEKLTLEYVGQYFEDQGCKLLEKEYIDNRTKMKYKCNCGNISEISFGSFKQGVRCKKCGGTEKLTLKYVEQYFEEHGCKLLEIEYINARRKMKYICECGEKNIINFNNFQQGKRCKKCAIKKNTGQNNCNWNPNLTDEEREANKTRHSDPIYKIWRTSTYIRDDYTCQKCLVRGGNLNAHHIEGYANNKDIRLDDDNGITFCKSCHIDFHKKYGYGNNTRQQLEEFLGIVLSCN